MGRVGSPRARLAPMAPPPSGTQQQPTQPSPGTTELVSLRDGGGGAMPVPPTPRAVPQGPALQPTHPSLVMVMLQVQGALPDCRPPPPPVAMSSLLPVRDAAGSGQSREVPWAAPLAASANLPDGHAQHASPLPLPALSGVTASSSCGTPRPRRPTSSPVRGGLAPASLLMDSHVVFPTEGASSSLRVFNT